VRNCERGLEDVVAERATTRYRPNERGSVKVQNPAYWRRDAEFEAMQPLARVSANPREAQTGTKRMRSAKASEY
jgi:hypothetical protein